MKITLNKNHISFTKINFHSRDRLFLSSNVLYLFSNQIYVTIKTKDKYCRINIEMSEQLYIFKTYTNGKTFSIKNSILQAVVVMNIFTNQSFTSWFERYIGFPFLT